MITMRVALPIALSACLLSGPVMGQGTSGFNGNFLHQTCTSSLEADDAICSGIIVGAIEGINYGLRFGPVFYGGDIDRPIYMFCNPQGATFAQSIDVVKLYLVNHPNERHYGVADLVALALTEAFPCAPVLN